MAEKIKEEKISEEQGLQELKNAASEQKTEKKETRKYALTFILNQSFNADASDELRNKINEAISSAGAKIEASMCSEAPVRLSYPIKKQHRGHVCESVFSCVPETIVEIGGTLKSNPDIMRFMVESKKETRAKKIRRRKPKDTILPSAEEQRKTTGSRLKEVRDRVSMEDIEKKLDEIIDNI